MRITNNIMINTSLLNLNRGLEQLQKADTQVQTGKKISTASEDPIISSKSIRYSTRLYEIEQYKSNVSAANSWLGSTDTALGTTVKILERMRTLIEECSTETLSNQDRLSNQVELKELREQLTQEANSSVAGRYLFSGYKTDEKVMFDTRTEKEYEISETIDYKKSTETLVDETGIKSSYSLKLAYGKVSNLKIKIGDDEYTNDSTSKFQIVYKNQSDTDAYNPQTDLEVEVLPATVPPTMEKAKVIHVINETGEIVFDNENYKEIGQNINVKYEKAGFDKGELNPIHYFECSEKIKLYPIRIGNNDTGKITLSTRHGIKEDSIKGLVIGGNPVINSDGTIVAGYKVKYSKSSDLSSVDPNEVRINMDDGTLVFGSDFDGKSIDVTSYYKDTQYPDKNVVSSKVKFVETNIGDIGVGNKIKINTKGTIDPNSLTGLSLGANDIIIDGEVQAGYTVKYTTSDDVTLLAPNEVRVNMDNGELVCGSAFNVGDQVNLYGYSRTTETKVNEEIQYEVNSNSKLTVNSLAPEVFTVEMINDLELIINRIDNFDRDEVTDLCARAMTEIDKHLANIVREESVVGSKINRLSLVEGRLDDDKINFEELKSDNENIDEAEALSNLALQELVYTAAMNATSKILQKSLLDFLG